MPPRLFYFSQSNVHFCNCVIALPRPAVRNRPAEFSSDRKSLPVLNKGSAILLSMTLLGRAENEAIAFAILEHCVGAPGLFLRRTVKLDAALLQFGICLVNVIARIRHVHHCSDTFFLTLSREQDYACLRFGDS